MGIPLSTLVAGKYTMLPSKDNETDVHETSIDQYAEEVSHDRSAFQRLSSFLARHLSRET